MSLTAAGHPGGADALNSLRDARALALYLLSVSVVACVQLAWRGRSAPDLFAWGVLLALGHPLGVALRGVVGGGRAWRRRSRLAAAVAYAAVLAFALLSLFGSLHPWLLARLSLALVLVQVVALVLSGLHGESLWALVNAVALSVLAALAGGWPAALAALSCVGLVGAVLGLDHFERSLAAQRVGPGPWVRLALRDTATLVLPATLGCAVFLAIAPPRAHPALGATQGLTHDPLSEPAAYVMLLLLWTLGGLGVWAASRLVRREDRLPPLDESVETIRLSEEVIAAEAGGAEAGRYDGPRGRVVRAYVGFLRRADRLGYVRRPEQTPNEFLLRLLTRPPGLERLTALFGASRYGPEDPSDAEAAEAERLADESARALHGRRRR